MNKDEKISLGIVLTSFVIYISLVICLCIMTGFYWWIKGIIAVVTFFAIGAFTHHVVFPLVNRSSSKS